MLGLKSLLPALGELIQRSPDALYERQRALVRLRLLSAGKGRGPGSGVRASPGALATLLIAILATDNLSETDERIADFLNAKHPKANCPLTGASTFGVALTRILASLDIAMRVTQIYVSRHDGRAVIQFKRAGKHHHTEFGHRSREVF